MGTLFEADPQVFLSQVSNSQFCDDDLMEIMTFYRKLSPFAKGMLLERALYLLDWDKFREENLENINNKKDAWKEESSENNASED